MGESWTVEARTDSAVAQQVMQLIERMSAAAETARPKEFVTDLTSDELTAVLLYAGVPYSTDIETGRLVFNRCSLTRRAGRWHVLC